VVSNVEKFNMYVIDSDYDLLDIEDIKIILSRVGENSPLILCGDITEKEDEIFQGLVSLKDKLK
jgi:predicted ribonuclease YlaK